MTGRDREGVELCPIGIFHGGTREHHCLPRQAGTSGQSGKISLFKGQNFEQGLQDLEGFDRIWVVYLFHESQSWKPLVRPPGERQKRGVFSTRAPCRPNPIGLSCLRLLGVSGLSVEVDEADLVDGTPILDIKPYLAYADAFPSASTGWIGRAAHAETQYSVEYSLEARDQLDWLDVVGVDLRTPIDKVLTVDPYPSSHNRVKRQGKQGVYACKTWRVHFTCDESDKSVQVDEIRSGYSEQDLESAEDPWGDKEVHRQYRAR